jgi:CBS domain-containing protein
MKVRDVMTKKAETVSMSSSLVSAAKLMRRQGIGFLPVIEDGVVVGVLTDRDIVLRGIAEGRNPYMSLVSDVMTPTLMWCYADDVLTKAAQVMEDSHIRRLLVLDDDKKLVGILSLDDLAARMSSDRLLGTIVRNTTAAA